MRLYPGMRRTLLLAIQPAQDRNGPGDGRVVGDKRTVESLLRHGLAKRNGKAVFLTSEGRRVAESLAADTTH